MTLSALDRLKQAANKNAAPAAESAQAAPATPVTPVTPVSTPAPAPAPAAPAAQTAPAAEKAVSTFVPVAAPKDATEAKNVLAALFNKSVEEVEAGAIFDEVNGQGGVAHTFPFAQVKNKNWEVYKKVPSEIAEFMPAGQRSYSMIYLGYRIGYTVWPISDNPKGKPDGRPPISRGVVPSSRCYAGSTELTRRLLGISSKVQYKKIKPETLKAKGLGKLTPETHIFGWTPNTGFIVLSIPGFKSSELTTAKLVDDNIRSCVGIAPLSFKLNVHETVNNKVAKDADNAKWEDAYVEVEAQPTNPRTAEYIAAWEAFMANNTTDVATAVQAFMAGTDFNGDTPEAAEKLVARFENCPLG